MSWELAFIGGHISTSTCRWPLIECTHTHWTIEPSNHSAHSGTWRSLLALWPLLALQRWQMVGTPSEMMGGNMEMELAEQQVKLMTGHQFACAIALAPRPHDLAPHHPNAPSGNKHANKWSSMVLIHLLLPRNPSVVPSFLPFFSFLAWHAVSSWKSRLHAWKVLRKDSYPVHPLSSSPTTTTTKHATGIINGSLSLSQLDSISMVFAVGSGVASCDWFRIVFQLAEPVVWVYLAICIWQIDCL